jgi:multidrug efflux pump subunit AcrA (membrane-fusion protein)
MLLPALATAAFVFAGWHMVSAQQRPPRAEPASPPPTVGAELASKEVVAGAGVVEARTQNIALGAPFTGVVAEVFAAVGDRVKPGQPLFALDGREAAADVAVRTAQLRAAEAQLTKLAAMPRSEELPPSQARIAEAAAVLAEREDAVQRSRGLFARRAVGQEELVKTEQNYVAAKAQLARAQADHRLLEAGAWEQDKAVARAAIAQAAAALEQARVTLDRHRILAPRVLDDGQPLDLVVMQVNVRPGEYVSATGSALMMLGNVDRLHVRVDVDEHDIPRFAAETPGRALVRGGGGKEFALRFVRVEPFVIPKKSLTGESGERVDTRVLQVLYEIQGNDGGLFVGQQVDAFLSAKPFGK